MSRSIYLIISLTILTLFLLSVVSCNAPRRCEVSQVDTIYVERVVERELLVYDTIEINSAKVEYLPDSLGSWKPSKMTVEKTVQNRLQTTTDKETITENIEAKVNKKIESNKPQSPKLKWFIVGFFVAVVVLLLITKR